MRAHFGLTLPAVLAIVAATSSVDPHLSAQTPAGASRTQGEVRRSNAIRARIPLRVVRHAEGMPVTLGVPFPKGALASPDQVRLLTHEGREHPAQVTEVSTWEPADRSVKWIWISFLTGRGDQYQVEYGADVRRNRDFPALEVVNNQREGGLLEVTTGPMRFVVQQGETGFLKSVALDLDHNGFDDNDLIAEGPAARGSFVDLLDDAGVDASKATIRQTFIERGSGPLHAILRIEGEYRYSRADNNAAPFVMRIHAYAGQPFIRVLHTFVYTGVPDKHRPVSGDYAHLATSKDGVITPEPGDTGWTLPNDRINASGLLLDLKLESDRQVRTSLPGGRWWQKSTEGPGVSRPLRGSDAISLVQLGPKPDRIPPVPESSVTERLTGFSAEVTGSGPGQSAERAERSARACSCRASWSHPMTDERRR